MCSLKSGLVQEDPMVAALVGERTAEGPDLGAHPFFTIRSSRIIALSFALPSSCPYRIDAQFNPPAGHLHESSITI